MPPSVLSYITRREANLRSKLWVDVDGTNMPPASSLHLRGWMVLREISVSVRNWRKVYEIISTHVNQLNYNQAL